MIEIIPCRDRLDELVQFAARLNSNGAHHIGFCGVDTYPEINRAWLFGPLVEYEDAKVEGTRLLLYNSG
ncbi:MAG TPA: hypothetical protein VJ821_08440 [Anaerolineales bacterium]|nr:hypothetical protein [Anaerolineales bacterium]